MMNRISVITLLAFGLILTGDGAAARGGDIPNYDVLIKGGTIFSGEDPPFRGEVAIRGDRIAYVGRKAPHRARRVIDARGAVVAPGFIDPHAHVDDALTSDIPAARLVLPFLLQGVTTAIIGVDGGGEHEVGPRLASPTGKPVGINFATYVGFSPVRIDVMGESDRQPTGAELARMRAMVARAMCAGAIGFSTGLFYAPQSFARSAEVIALAREAAARGGIFDSHIREEGRNGGGWQAAIDEVVDVGRAAGLPVHIAHLKALGVDAHGDSAAIIAAVERARSSGVRVTTDQYPWTASSTMLHAVLIPRWALEGGVDALRRRIAEPAALARIKADMRERLRQVGGAQSLALYADKAKLRGERLDAYARRRNLDPIDAALLLLSGELVRVVSYNMIEADVEAFMRRPWVMTSSDASLSHPRYYGSFAHKYGHYVRLRSTLGLREFIERSSRLTADTLGLVGRGRLRAGAFADVLVFDPGRYAARATFDAPELFATGVRTVLVNGEIAVEDGRPTGVAAGRGLAHTPPRQTCSAS